RFAGDGFGGGPAQVVGFPVDLGGGRVRLSCLGIGGAAPGEVRRAGAAFAGSVRGGSRAAVNAAAAEHDPAALTAFVEGALLASYTFTLTETAKGAAPAARVDLTGSAAAEAAEPVRRGTLLARATATARDLINTPAAEKSPAWLAARAEEIGGEA